MDARLVKAMVDDFAEWKGDSYRLAMNVSLAQREADIAKLEALGMTEAADALRDGA